MKKVDLHIHTVATVSDHYFEFSMDTLQSYVECKELDAIAVTNHNLFDRKQYEEICEKTSEAIFDCDYSTCSIDCCDCRRRFSVKRKSESFF